MPVKDVLDHPTLYRLWQAPFVRQKLRPLLAEGTIDKATSVLDVGCGPGTNTVAFAHVPRYVGVDLNPAYVAFAQKRYNRDFRVADVTKDLPEGETFDLIFMNSLMHHLSDAGAVHLLESLPARLAPGGEIHILDLVLSDYGLPRKLALADRGEHPRPVTAWRSLVGETLEVVDVTSYYLHVGPVNLWEMIHLKAVGELVGRPS